VQKSIVLEKVESTILMEFSFTKVIGIYRQEENQSRKKNFNNCSASNKKSIAIAK